jgi:hypothetical protein
VGDEVLEGLKEEERAREGSGMGKKEKAVVIDGFVINSFQNNIDRIRQFKVNNDTLICRKQYMALL